MNPRWQINKTENECVNERIYNYILSGQKNIKNAKDGQFVEFLKNLKLVVKQCYKTCQF